MRFASRLHRFNQYETIELNEVFQLIKIIMIVLKATQDKILAVLQTVAGIVERRHTLPILANVLIRRTTHVDPFRSESCLSARQNAEALPMTKLRQAFVLCLPRTSYFSSKVNGRNAP